MTLVLTTHYMDEAEQLCDRLVVMDRGRIAREGEPADLIAPRSAARSSRFGSRRRRSRSCSPASAPRSSGHQIRGEVLNLFSDDAEELFVEARATGVPLELQMVRRATLEDVFLAVTGHLLREDARLARFRAASPLVRPEVARPRRRLAEHLREPDTEDVQHDLRDHQQDHAQRVATGQQGGDHRDGHDRESPLPAVELGARPARAGRTRASPSAPRT